MEHLVIHPPCEGRLGVLFSTRGCINFFFYLSLFSLIHITLSLITFFTFFLYFSSYLSHFHSTSTWMRVWRKLNFLISAIDNTASNTNQIKPWSTVPISWQLGAEMIPVINDIVCLKKKKFSNYFKEIASYFLLYEVVKKST